MIYSTEIHQMEYRLLFILLIISSLSTKTALVSAYGTGGPIGSCQTLIPSHGVDKQYGLAPYDIRAVQGPSGSVIVSIVGHNQPFAGFMLQSRFSNDRERIVNGRFSEDSYSQTRNCNGDTPNTLTHRSPIAKYKIESSWTPPRGFIGGVVFRATIVQSKNVFWTTLDSQPIQISGNSPTKGSAIKYKEENSKHKNSERNVYNENRNSQFDDNIHSPSLSRSSQSSALNPYNDGGINYDLICEQKFCFGLPANCLQYRNCIMLLAGGYVNYFSDGIVEFEIYANVRPDTNAYYSMALSNDNKMGEDSVTDCTISEGEVQIRNSVNIGKSNQQLSSNEFVGVTPLNTSFANGILTCRWRRLRRSTVRDQSYDLRDNKYYILLAYGLLRSDDRKIKHLEALSSDEVVDIRTIGHISAYSKVFLIKLHGSFMVIAWLGTVSIGIFIARHYKNVCDSKTFCGVKVWFAIHRSLMIFSIIVILMASICIYIYVGTFVFGPHQCFGLLAIIIAISQPIGAAFRPHPETPKRWIFNWLHWLNGNAGHICAIIALFLAYNMPVNKLPPIYLWLLIVYLLFHVISHLILQFYSCGCRDIKSFKSKTSDISLRNINSRNNDEMLENSGLNSFLQFYLGLYLVVVVVIVLALILSITIPHWSYNTRIVQ